MGRKKERGTDQLHMFHYDGIMSLAGERELPLQREREREREGERLDQSPMSYYLHNLHRLGSVMWETD